MVDWHAFDMEQDRKARDFERRLEETGGEICERLERIERCCKEAEDARRRDWEKFEGRMMTAAERHRFELDGIRRTSARMTDEYVRVIRATSDDIKREFAEGREEARAASDELLAEARAQREAFLKLLDRLLPGD